MKKPIILFLLSSFLLQSCVNKTEKKPMETQQTTKVVEKDSIENDVYTEMNDEPDEDDFVYPKTGNKASDFIPKMTIQDYEIQYKAKGDLNGDNLDDIVVVLRNKEIKVGLRPMLILLQNTDKTYRLDKVSNVTMPAEYSENDFKNYDKEDIRIEDEVLKIELFGTGGPIGNTFSHFRYIGKDLVLSYIETYNVGAGSWQQLYYNLETGELTQEVTNTMKEDMPTTAKTFKLKKEKHFFEDTSPDDVIREAYRKIDSQW